MNEMRKAATVEDFETKYQQNADPWGYRDSWYERRKYAVTLACLPRERYRLVWEPACSIGVLTGLLARRADRVLASDGSATAIAAARTAELPADAGQVDWSVQALPGVPDIDPGQADLVMLSEILYYLAEPDRDAVLATAQQMLAPDGDLVVVHWRPLPGDAHLSGDAANAWVRSRLADWSVLSRHDDEEFVLDVLRRR
jgi:2-polyprenyl-3-methyl-5-hydroxy-6-metoxy-1,4-benzoquinol methylase